MSAVAADEAERLAHDGEAEVGVIVGNEAEGGERTQREHALAGESAGADGDLPVENLHGVVRVILRVQPHQDSRQAEGAGGRVHDVPHRHQHDDRHRQHADDQLETGSRHPQQHGEDGDIHQSGAEVGLQNHQNQRNEYVNAQRNQLVQRLNRLPALGKQVCQRDDDGDLTEFGRLQTALTQVTGAGAPLEEGGHTAAAGFHRKHGRAE